MKTLSKILFVVGSLVGAYGLAHHEDTWAWLAGSVLMWGCAITSIVVGKRMQQAKRHSV